FNSLINWNYFKEERFLYHFDVTIVLLIPALLIIFEIIELQKDIEKLNQQKGARVLVPIYQNEKNNLISKKSREEKF
ncbi:MAG: hypothetical protein ACK4UJ_12610, partial [Leptonema sp. (in: bacteria)]